MVGCKSRPIVIHSFGVTSSMVRRSLRFCRLRCPLVMTRYFACLNGNSRKASSLKRRPLFRFMRLSAGIGARYFLSPISRTWAEMRPRFVLDLTLSSRWTRPLIWISWSSSKSKVMALALSAKRSSLKLW